jgi:XRE family transcriptional regulator, regulator of sulfur utilization
MKKIQQTIGENLKTLRQSRGLSLDQTSALTGVSKAMLGQIERGESNPTVATLWKIANGLKVSFSSLLKVANAPVTIIRHHENEPIPEDDGKYRVYPIIPFDPEKKFEVFIIELDPGCNYVNTGHAPGMEEYITMIKGTMHITVDETVYTLNQGDSLHFQGNVYHVYENRTNETIMCQMMIYYTED